MAPKKPVYFIGIGGIGMSALARYYKARNRAVSGSDLSESDITRELKKEGIKVKIGHKKAHISPETGLVVYNRAIKPDNPELLAARKLGMPAVPYSNALGLLTRKYVTIAITGSHGKSTTTALAGLALTRAGLDPTVLLGTNLKEFGGKNIRIGRGRHLVLEADDFGAAFLDYSHKFAIITNIDKEHLDFYGNFKNLKKAFVKFLENSEKNGTAILNFDDEPLYSLKSKISALGRRRGLKIIWYSLKSPAAKKISRIIKIPGKHNVSNALAVYFLAKELKISEKIIFRAISAYRGAWRRMEYRGFLRIPYSEFRIPVYDDYAHHPTEIKATLSAFREKFPQAGIICVFQPHQAERLRLLFKDFIDAFGDAELLVIPPIYKVAGREMSKFDSRKLIAAIRKKYPSKPVFYLNNLENIKIFIKKILMANCHTPPHILVMMGAGDIADYTEKLI